MRYCQEEGLLISFQMNELNICVQSNLELGNLHMSKKTSLVQNPADSELEESGGSSGGGCGRWTLAGGGGGLLMVSSHLFFLSVG